MTLRTLLKALYYNPQLNRFARPAYGLLSPPPYRRADMEFTIDVWNGISSFASSDGRPLGEHNATPRVHCPVTETLSKISIFPGSRIGMPVNVTALRTVMRVWDDVCQFAALMRSQHLKVMGLPDQPLSLLQGYLLSKTAAGRVAFLVRSSDNHLKPSDLDAVETAFFTLGVGPFMLARSLMEQGELAAMECPQLSGEQMYQLADQHGTLVSSNGWACAGNPKLIVDFMDLVLNGRGVPTAFTSTPAMRAFERIKDWDRFYRYLYASSRLELILKLATAVGKFFSLKESGDSVVDAIPDAGHQRSKMLSNTLRINVALLSELRCNDAVEWLQEISMADFGANFALAPSAQDEVLSAFADRVQSAAQSELDQIGHSLGRQPYHLDRETFRHRVWGELH